jgi:hypothetical protein
MGVARDSCSGAGAPAAEPLGGGGLTSRETGEARKEFA